MNWFTKWRCWMTTFPEVPTRQQVSTVRLHFHRNLSSHSTCRKCRALSGNVAVRTKRLGRTVASIKTSPRSFSRYSPKKGIVCYRRQSFRHGSFNENSTIFRHLYKLSRFLLSKAHFSKLLGEKEVLHTNMIRGVTDNISRFSSQYNEWL